MNGNKRGFPALVISEAECYGGKSLWLSLFIFSYILVAYSDVGSTGTMSGSLLDVLNTLTETSLEEIDVSCCKNGVHSSNETFGNGTSCEHICGENNEGICLLFESKILHQVWILGFADLAITSTATSADICSTTISIRVVVSIIPIYRLGFYLYRVKRVQQLNQFKICCFHPVVYSRPGVKTRCCQFGWCV